MSSLKTDALHVYLLSSRDAFEPLLKEVDSSSKCGIYDNGVRRNKQDGSQVRNYKDAWGDLLTSMGGRSGSSLRLMPSAILVSKDLQSFIFK
jgi:hypothetical protein